MCMSSITYVSPLLYVVIQKIYAHISYCTYVCRYDHVIQPL